MLKQMLLSTAVVAFGLVGPVNAQEPAKQTQDQRHPQKRVLQIQSGDPAPIFAANFDRASRTLRPAPLAPGSAEVP